MDEKLYRLTLHTIELVDCGRTLLWNVKFSSNVKEKFLRSEVHAAAQVRLV